LTHSRKSIHAPTSFGARLADAVAAGTGSWRFIIGYLTLTFLWCGVNLFASFAWDKYPFIFYTFSVSVLAILMSAVILLSQNRQAQRDRARDDLEAGEVHRLMAINEQQLQILGALNDLMIDVHALAHAGGVALPTPDPTKP